MNGCKMLAICLVLLSATIAVASITGTISGIVTDPAGAVVSDAKVTATNVLTGVERTVTTDAKGFYSFLALPLGTYTISVHRDGFRDFQQNEIVIDANSSIRVDAKLQVGAVHQQVVVSSTAVQVETTNTQMGEVINGSSITSIPLNGRSFTDLLALQPGVVPQSTGEYGAGFNPSGDLNAGNLSVSGQRESANGFMVNGGDVEEAGNMGTAVVPNLDSIAEFRILTNNFDAQYGNYMGGLVNVVTKSGTNQFHGDIFEFVRFPNLDARNYFSPTRATLHRNQFGGTVGGPLVHSKIFFFGDYQGTRQVAGQDGGVIPVLSAAERTGDLTDISSQLTGTVNGPFWASTLSNALGYTVNQDEPYYFSAAPPPNAYFPMPLFLKALGQLRRCLCCNIFRSRMSIAEVRVFPRRLSIRLSTTTNSATGSMPTAAGVRSLPIIFLTTTTWSILTRARTYLDFRQQLWGAHSRSTLAIPRPGDL